MGDGMSAKKKRPRLINKYPYNDIFTEDLDSVSEIFGEAVSNGEAYKYKNVAKKIVSGNQMEFEIRPGFLFGTTIPSYAKSDYKVSEEKQKEYNTRKKYKKFERYVHGNFNEGDLLTTLTFADQYLPDSEEATRKIVSEKFIASLRDKRKRRGLPPMKYIYVIERGRTSKRWHIHMIMDNLLDIKEVNKSWKWGNVDFSPLTYKRNKEGERNFVPLCKYLAKHKDIYPNQYKHGKKWDFNYTPSRGLIKPKEQEQKTPLAEKAVKAMSVKDETERLNAARQIFEKRYKDYEVVAVDVKINQYYDGMKFVSVRLQKRAGSNKKNRHVQI